MNQPIISLTTDFGDTFACAQLETVIHILNPKAKFIVASNEITAFSILEGAFVLLKFYPLTSKGSIHIAVIDPGVGSARRGIILKTNNYWFVGPDNGSLFPAAQSDSIQQAYIISEEKMGQSLSNTFHGRDVFAKVAAYLSLNKNPLGFADPIPIEEIATLEFVDNQVLHIDPYGNIKLSSYPQDLNYGDQLKISFSSQICEVPFVKTFADVSPGELLIYLGSHQTLEIAQNLGSANQLLNLKIGDVLEIKKVR